MANGVFPLSIVEEVAAYGRRKGGIDASQAVDLGWIVFSVGDVCKFSR